MLVRHHHQVNDTLRHCPATTFNLMVNLRGVLKIQLFLFLTSFHAVGLAGLCPHARRVADPREARGRLTRGAWQVKGNDKACQANGMGN